MELISWFQSPGRIFREPPRDDLTDLGLFRFKQVWANGQRHHVLEQNPARMLRDPAANFTLLPTNNSIGSSFSLQLPDGGPGGNARGAASVDLSLQHYNLGGATGSVSFAAGYNPTASGSYTVAFNGTASGAYSINLGVSGVASATGAVVLGGWSAVADCAYEHAQGGQTSGVSGDTQRSSFVLQCACTNGSATTMVTDPYYSSAGSRVNMRVNMSWAFRAVLVARTSTASGTIDSVRMERIGLFSRGSTAASTTLVGITTPTADIASAGATGWVLAITADTTNGGPKFQFTAANGVRAVLYLEAVEHAYA